MRRTHLLGLLTAPVVGLSLVATVPVAAHAAQSTTAVSGQTFASDAAGWTATTTYGGLCVPMLLCPAVTATHAATGGTGGAGDGYLRTTYSSLANTALGSTVTTWESPAFRYSGVAGETPTSVSVDLSRKARLAAMLPVDLANTSSFRVDLVDETSHTALTAVDTTQLPVDTAWTAVPTVSVNPAQLTIGHDYTLRITTTYASTATVTAGGEVGYDDVRVTATRVTQDPPVVPEPPVIIYPVPTPTPTPVTPVTPVTPGIGFKTTRELRQYVQTTGLPGTARLARPRLKLRVSCSPLAAPKACKYAIQGLSAGRGSAAATSRKVLTIQPGQSRTVRLVIRRAYLARFGKGTTMSVRAKVRVGVFKVTVVKKVRIR